MNSNHFHSRTRGMVLILLISSTALADVSESTTSSSSTESVHTSLTDSERAAATLWDLNESEWHRYRSLQRGIRSSISPENLSPIEVLGIHARDASERRRYAEQWARAMRDDTERVLAFQHAYDKAIQRLLGNQLLIDVNRLKADSEQQPLFGKDARLVFVTRSDCPACDAVFDKIQQHMDHVDGVDIYFDSSTADRAAIRNWAKDKNIDAQWVRSRRVTLNEGTAGLPPATAAADGAPHVYLQRGGDYRKLSYAEL